MTVQQLGLHLHLSDAMELPAEGSMDARAGHQPEPCPGDILWSWSKGESEERQCECGANLGSSAYADPIQSSFPAAVERDPTQAIKAFWPLEQGVRLLGSSAFSPCPCNTVNQRAYFKEGFCFVLVSIEPSLRSMPVPMWELILKIWFTVLLI